MTYFIREKENYFELEDKNLASYAKKSFNSHLERLKPSSDEDPDERTPFQLDRDKIIHSRAFRRLANKTQVLTANKGDHYRTRLTHTIEVSQIARSMAKRLGLNEELTEAIALGHDIGHTPFGHIGERTLDGCASNTVKEITGGSVNGFFKHNIQSIHIADNLEQWKDDNLGFNLTLSVRDGILKHTKLEYVNKSGIDNKTIYKYPELININLNTVPITIEGQIVKIADDIAQVTHDLEDCFRFGIVKIQDIENNSLIEFLLNELKLKKETIQGYDARQIRCHIIGPLVGILLNDAVKTTLEKINKDNLLTSEIKKNYVSFSDWMQIKFKDLKKLINELFITSLEITTADRRAEHIINNIFDAYYNNPKLLPDLVLKKYMNGDNNKFSRLNMSKGHIDKLQKDISFVRAICDHIAGMTDMYAFSEYKKLYLPE